MKSEVKGTVRYEERGQRYSIAMSKSLGNTALQTGGPGIGDKIYCTQARI
jgi:hypothetical protein